ncbi:MAG: EAL domain-containing protein [Rhizobiaceae bacterium]|nr:EAL domain-containing protein [Rhizobiaceae bacterium]
MMVRLLAILVVLSGLFAGLAHMGVAQAIEPVRVTQEAQAIDLTDAVEITRGEGEAFQISAAPGADGVVRRIEIRAIDANPTGNWAVFALSNPTDEQLDRLLVAPHFKLAGSGVVWPDLGQPRIANITPSEGFALERENDTSADVFSLTLNPGSVVTFVVEMSSDRLPELQLWDPAAFKESQNAFTLFRGIVIGIAGLLALFLTIVFIVRGTSLFPATAALAWGVLAYVALDFGFLAPLLGASPLTQSVWRAGTEVALAAILLLFLFSYLRLSRWNRHLGWLVALWLAALAVLAFFAVVDPEKASGLARASFAGTIIAGVPLIVVLGLKGFDRAVMLVPTWALMIAWLTASWMTVTGQIDNPVIQPALGGAMVLIIVLLGFTVMQHAFAGGTLEKGLFSELERKALALTGAEDIVWDWDVVRDRISLLPDFSESLGLERNALSAPPRQWLDHIHRDDRDRFRATLDAVLEHKRGRIADQFRLQSPGGRMRWFALKARPVIGHDGEVIRCIGTMSDVTDQRVATERLMHNAVTDHLTGLPNREMFIGLVANSLKLIAPDSGRKVAVLSIDIDNYRAVNQGQGIAAGDAMLLTLSRRIQQLLKPQDSLCRVVGDEFAVLLLSEPDASGVAALAERQGSATQELSASIGLALSGEPGQSADDLLKDAELAMHHAKRSGGNRIEPFRPAFRVVGSNVVQLEADLRRALERGEMHLVYQPIIRLSDSSIAGFEALMRWRSPRRGLIPPTEFIPVAEKSGLITKLGQFALTEAASQLRQWQFAIGDVPVFVAVNLSSVQVLRQDLAGDVAAVLESTGLNPRSLRLELTESMVMEDPERAAGVLQALRGLGVSLSLDDFGTGHSSLSYLTRFPFDCIKIDRSFLAGEGARRDTLLKALVTLGVDLGMSVVAEGVETDEDAAALAAMGCAYVQSHAFGEPRDAEQTLKLLRSRTMPVAAA